MSNKSITLTGTTAVFDGNDLRLPATVTLKSSDATRKIELSTNGGSEYFTPGYDVTSATQLGVVIKAPVTNIRGTGIVNDVLYLSEAR